MIINDNINGLCPPFKAITCSKHIIYYILVLLECYGEIWRAHHVRECSDGAWHTLPKRCIDASTHIELEVVVTLKIPNLYYHNIGKQHWQCFIDINNSLPILSLSAVKKLRQLAVLRVLNFNFSVLL